MEHLANVAAHSEVNMMSFQNLAVCFGPTLLRREDGHGPASDEVGLQQIVDIRHGNAVVTALLESWEVISPAADTSEEDDQSEAIVYSNLSVPVYLPRSQVRR